MCSTRSTIYFTWIYNEQGSSRALQFTICNLLAQNMEFRVWRANKTRRALCNAFHFSFVLVCCQPAIPELLLCCRWFKWIENKVRVGFYWMRTNFAENNEPSKCNTSFASDFDSNLTLFIYFALKLLSQPTNWAERWWLSVDKQKFYRLRPGNTTTRRRQSTTQLKWWRQEIKEKASDWKK